MSGAGDEGRMRLTLVGGYLGSGKTTWLRHQLFEKRYGRAHVLVNEAAETPVDDALLRGAQELEVLAGGCVCCDARDQLVTTLRAICDRRSRIDSREARTDEIVLETSGLADPASIVEAIRTDPVLVYHVVVSEVVVIVDGLHSMAQLHSEPLGRRQIETADRLVLTKIDIADPAALRTLIATLRVINPGAALSGSVLGTTAALPEVSEDVAPADLPALADNGAEPVFPTRLVLDEGIDWTTFSVWLSALLHARGDDILRVKGVVRTPAGRLLLQAVRRVVQSPEILPEQSDRSDREDGTVVIIGRGYAPEDLRRSLDRFNRLGRG